MVRAGASPADRQYPPLEGDSHPVESDTRHLGEHDDVVGRFIDVGRRHEYRLRGRSLPGFCRLRSPLLDSSDFLGHIFYSFAQGHAARISVFWPAAFQSLQSDFQDAAVETGLDLVGVNPEWKLDRPRKRAVSALATLPIGILLLGRTSCSLQGQHVFPQVDRDIVPRASVTKQILIGGKSRAAGENPANKRFISLCIRRSSTKGSKPNCGNSGSDMVLTFLAIEIAHRAGLPLVITAKVDKADRTYYKNRIKPLLKDPLVDYIGEIGDSEKGAFLGDAVALLFPIDWPEPFGLTLIEAMANGTPVIAFGRGSVPEIVDDGVTGLIVNSVDEAVAAVPRAKAFGRAVSANALRSAFRSSDWRTTIWALYNTVLRRGTVDAVLNCAAVAQAAANAA